MSNEITEFERKYEGLDEQTLLEMLPSVVAQRIKAIPDEIKSMSEEDLEKAGKINATDTRLRTAFWLEFDRAVRTKKPMMMTNVFSGSCSRAYWQNEIITRSYKLAYIIQPPVEVQIGLEEIMLMGISEMKKIMALPNLNDKGQVDARLIDVKRKIFEDVTNRRRGHVLRRTEVQTKNLNLNLAGDVSNANPIVDIDAQLAELEGHSLPAPTAARDIVEQVLDVQAKEEVPAD